MKMVKLDQRTDDWKMWRNTGIGSSDASVIVGLSKWKSRDTLLAEKRQALYGDQFKITESPLRKKYLSNIPMENRHISRGVKLEPIALAQYNRVFKSDLSPLCCVHDNYSYLKASLDGWDANNRMFVEIKSPHRNDHVTALGGNVPRHYLPQLHHLFLVTGASFCHYVSYCEHPDFLTQQRLLVLPVYRNEPLINLLHKAEEEFWLEVTNVPSISLTA